MPEKKINLYFYQINPTIIDEENKDEQNDAIKNVFTQNPETFTPIQRSDSKVSLYGKIEKRGKLYLGTLLNNQTSDIPPSYDEDKNALEPLNLSERQGLAFATSFLYDPDLRIVMIESIRNGVGIGTFCNFLQNNYAIPSIDSAFVINPADLKKFYDMSYIRRFQVKVARVENGSIFKGGKKSIGQITDSADNTNTDTLEYSLSVKKGHDSLALSKIRNFVSTLLQYKDTNEVEVLKVTGKEDEDSTSDTVDFIKQRMKDFITIEKQRLVSSFLISEHYNKMIEIYNKHQSSLQIYKLKKV